jgi:hypothetical protein
MIAPEDEPFIDLVQIRAQGSFGTGLLIARGLVLTALHCAANPKEQWRTRDQLGVYLFRDLKQGSERHRPAHIAWPRTSELGADCPDVAVLRIDEEAPPYPLARHPFGELPRVTTLGSAQGFPFSARGSQLPGGRVEHDQPGRVHYTSSTRRALTLDSTGRHQLEDYRRWTGLSGGPLLVHGLIVGIMREVPDGWMGEAIEAEALGPLLRNDTELQNLLGVTLPLQESTSSYDFDWPSWRATSKAAGRIKGFVQEYLINDGDVPGVPFGGRASDLNRLDTWLNDSTSEPRYLLTAPIGRGKSALLVRWIQQLRLTGRVGERNPDSWRLVFVPISVTYETHLPEDFFQAIAFGLEEILQKITRTTPGYTVREWADYCKQLTDEVVENGSRTLIVIDGIDESLGDSFHARWFSKDPGSQLKLLLSARWKSGDEDSHGWVERLRWENTKVRTHELPLVSLEGVEEALVGIGTPDDLQVLRPDLASRVYQLSQGEPLVIRYYVEDIWKARRDGSRLTVGDLENMKPGFDSFFRHSLKEQQTLWESSGRRFEQEKVDAVLAVLACAHGRLRDIDLIELLEAAGAGVKASRLADQLEPISRFIIGFDRAERKSAGYILSHFKLGLYLREEHFDYHYIEQIEAAFVKWGRHKVSLLNSGDLNAADLPQYLLQYYAQHLRDLDGSADDFCALLASGWRRSWQLFEAGYRGYSRDVTTVYRALTELKNDENKLFVSRFHCQLILCSIHSIGSQTPWRVLVAGVRTGVLTYFDALHWLEFAGTLRRALALASLIPYVHGEIRADLLAEVISAIPASAVACAGQPFPDENSLPEIIAGIAPHLSDTQVREVLTKISGIDDALIQAAAAVALMPKLTPAERHRVARQLLARAKGVDRGAIRHTIIGTISPYLPPRRANYIVLAEARLVARRVLLAPNEIAYANVFALLLSRCPPSKRVKPLSTFLTALSDSNARLTAESIAAIAPHFPAELLPEALRLVNSIDKDDLYEKITTLVTLTAHMPLQQRRSVLEEALRETRQIEYEFPRVLCLVQIALSHEGDERQRLLIEAQGEAEKIGWGDDRAAAYACLAEHLQDQQLRDLVSKALSQGREIGWDIHRHEALETLSKYCEADDVSQALLQARAIDDGTEMAHSLTRIVAKVPHEARVRSFKTALVIARGTTNPYQRARILVALAPGLPPVLRFEAGTIARELMIPGARALALCALCVGDTQLTPEATAALREVNDPGYQAELFAEIGGAMPLDFVGQALLAFKEKGKGRDLASFAEAIAPRLSDEQREAILTIARRTGDNGAVARVLAAIAKTHHNPSELFFEVLEIIDSETEEARGSILSKVAPDLTSDLLDRAIQVAMGLKDSYLKAKVLTSFASNPYVSDREGLLAHALLATQEIRPDELRAKSLISLAPYLPENSKVAAVGTALSIAKEFLDGGHVYEALQIAFNGPPNQISRSAFELLLDHFHRVGRRELFWRIEGHLRFMIENSAENAEALACSLVEIWDAFQ